MVEYRSPLNSTYRAISHPVRRHMLQRLSTGAARISDLAGPHEMSFAAVSKHVGVLEEAGLIKRYIKGREHWLELEASRLRLAADWLESYRHFWEGSLDRLEARLRSRGR